MKNKIFIFLFIVGNICCHAQLDYFTDDLQWTILDASGDAIDEGKMVSYHVGNDTIVNNKNYKRIENYLIRQDGYKIFINDLFSDKEDFLLYDFSLKVGDSIANPWGEYAKVIGRTKKTLLDGTNVIHLSYEGRSDDEELIGNVQMGLIGYYDFFRMGCTDISLLCLQRNDILLYEKYDNACESIRTEYHPLLTNNKTWSYFYNRVNEPDSNKEILSTRTFSIKGDTTVWDRDYKIISSDWEDHITWIFREDVSEQKVYARVLADAYCDCDDCYYCNGKEYLLYDFSVNKGDTVEVLVGGFAYEGTLKYVVKDVFYETIQPSGESRKHIHLDPIKVESPYYLDEILNRSITWIEGIGNTYYEFIPTNLMSIGFGKLMCATEGDELIYSTELGRKYECYVDTVIDRTALDMIDCVNIHLVVKEDMLRVESNDGINHIAIYDPQGKQILQSPKSSVDISSLSSGLYLVNIRTDKGLWSDKFVK